MTRTSLGVPQVCWFDAALSGAQGSRPAPPRFSFLSTSSGSGAPPSLPDLPLEEAKATGELFALMHCGPPFALEHCAANHPQPIELLMQLAVCPGRQRFVDSVQQSLVELGHSL